MESICGQLTHTLERLRAILGAAQASAARRSEIVQGFSDEFARARRSRVREAFLAVLTESVGLLSLMESRYW